MTIHEIIEQMSLEEKCAFLSGKNHWESWNFNHLGVKPITMADGPHGVRKQLGDADHLGLNKSVASTCFPTAATIANSWDVELAEEIGKALGKEATALEVDMLLGPGLNIKRSPLCGRNFEYFSEDPYLSGKMAAGYVRGIQEAGVAACPKHFAVNSQETIRMSSDSIIDERTLREIYLSAFEIVVKDSQPRALMTCYNKINGTYGNEHPYLLQTILRDEWGFDGTIVTDWGGSNDHVAGVQAGSTLEMPSPGLEPARELMAAVQVGTLDEETVNQRVAELLKEAMVTPQANTLDKDDQEALALKAAEESIVLLKNKNDILPLQHQTSCAVIGDFASKPRYQGSGSSFVEPTRLEDSLSCLNDSSLEVVGYAQGFKRDGAHDEQLLHEALQLAEQSDVVLLYMGLPENFETEGMDRQSMKVPENQLHLLRTLKEKGHTIISIFSAGSPTEMNWLENTDATLHCYLGGQAGALAAVHILTGQANPSGKLAETYACKIEDTPTAQFYPSTLPMALYRENIFVGYRYYETAGVEVDLPFGFGLSYTTFEYSNIDVQKDGVSFTLTNIGERAGSEIAQMYIKLKESKLFRSTIELKGFQKIYLEPNESKQITIPFDEYTFRYYNVATSSWEIEVGTYEVCIGRNVRDICVSDTLLVEGTTSVIPYTDELIQHYKDASSKNFSEAMFSQLIERELPPNKWSKKIDKNMPVLRIQHSKNWVARQVYKVLENKKRKAEEKGTPDLNILFIMNIPFRGIAKMTNGLVSMQMVDGMLLIVNGHFFKGTNKTIAGFFKNKKENKKFLRQMEEITHGTNQ